MYYYQYMLKSVPTSKATMQPSPGYRSMLVFLCVLALVALAGCAGGGASVPSARATACLGAIAVSLSGCQQSQIQPPAKAHTSFCVNVAHAWETTVSPIDIRAAKFDCVRVDFRGGASSPFISRALAAGLKAVMISDIPTSADFADPSGYIAKITVGERAFPGQSWEFIPEPDVLMTAAQYIALGQRVLPAMRQADPTATLILGGVANGSTKIGATGGIDFTWIRAVNPLYALVDEVGIHPYPPPWLDTPIASLPSVIAQVAQITGKPTVVTEWGLAQQFAPLKPGDPLPNPLTQAQAAEQIVQMLNTVDGFTPMFNVYEWDNRDDKWAGTEGFGIVGTPELAAFTAARLR